jgi:hypothetical protein
VFFKKPAQPTTTMCVTYQTQHTLCGHYTDDAPNFKAANQGASTKCSFARDAKLSQRVGSRVNCACRKKVVTEHVAALCPDCKLVELERELMEMEVLGMGEGGLKVS